MGSGHRHPGWSPLNMNRLAEFAYQACSLTALRRCSDRTLVPSGFGGRHARFGISPSPSGGTHQACPDNPGYRHRSGADAAGRRTYRTCGPACERFPIQCEKTLGHPGWRPPIPRNAHQCNDRMRMLCERRDRPRHQPTIDDGADLRRPPSIGFHRSSSSAICRAGQGVPAPFHPGGSPLK